MMANCMFCKNILTFYLSSASLPKLNALDILLTTKITHSVVLNLHRCFGYTSSYRASKKYCQIL